MHRLRLHRQPRLRLSRHPLRQLRFLNLLRWHRWRNAFWTRLLLLV